MDNIVNFPNPTYQSGSQKLNGSAGSARRGNALRSALAAKETFSPEDQLRVPSNLHNILEDMHANRGLKKRKVAEACGMGGGGSEDSTKRLYEYTLPANASDRRKSKAAKKPGKYFDIAAAIARLSGNTEDEMLSRVFKGCSYGTGSSFKDADDWDEVRWSRLCTLMTRMCDSVTTRTKLTEYWRAATQVTGCYDPVSGKFEHSDQPLDALDCGQGLTGAMSSPEDLPPIPSVLLGKHHMLFLQEAELPLDDGTSTIAWLSVMMEIRLAIAPVSFDGKPGPLFEFRLCLGAEGPDGEEIDFDAPVTIQSSDEDGRRVASIDGVDFQIKLDPDLWLPPAFFELDWSSTEYAWEEINPALMRDLFCYERRLTPMAWMLEGNRYDTLPPSRFASGTPGSCLQGELISGRLETNLTNASHELYQRLMEYQRELTDRISEMEAEAEKRWLKDL